MGTAAGTVLIYSAAKGALQCTLVSGSHAQFISQSPDSADVCIEVISWPLFSSSFARMEATVEGSTVFSGTLRKIYCTVVQMILTSQNGTCRLARHGGQFSLFYLKTTEFDSLNDENLYNDESLVVGCVFEVVFLWPNKKFQSTLTCLALRQPPKGRQSGKQKLVVVVYFFLVVQTKFFASRLSWYFHSVAFKS